MQAEASIVASPAGDWWINTTGNPGMATAGMGDVLSGLIVALLAQGWPADKALLAAVHLHGAAADDLVAQGIGPVGLTAGEVIDAARTVFNLKVVKVKITKGWNMYSVILCSLVDSSAFCNLYLFLVYSDFDFFHNREYIIEY